ncbi:MAG: hypothetical protein CVV00_13775 [Firmicutes bacterium HGW-Firmicutes-5]|nr:MAG: hypothetical protein CVV00_13775 [Firmicutes bacterium HGW-Firmicutes-5]
MKKGKLFKRFGKEIYGRIEKHIQLHCEPILFRVHLRESIVSNADKIRKMYHKIGLSPVKMDTKQQKRKEMMLLRHDQVE